jgi:hypothetical protein
MALRSQARFQAFQENLMLLPVLEFKPSAPPGACQQPLSTDPNRTGEHQGR